MTSLSNPTIRTLAGIAAAAAPDPALAAVTLTADPTGATNGGDRVEAVVLTRIDDGAVEVVVDGQPRSYAGTLPVSEITDPDRRLRLLTAALLALDGDRRGQADRARLLTDGHAGTLEAIRSYAIDAHVDGPIGLDDLNNFLRAFGLAEYRPRVRVSYVLRGSYVVALDDTQEASDDAEENLGPDLSGVHRLLDDTAQHRLEVDTVECLDT